MRVERSFVFAFVIGITSLHDITCTVDAAPEPFVSSGVPSTANAITMIYESNGDVSWDAGGLAMTTLEVTTALGGDFWTGDIPWSPVTLFDLWTPPKAFRLVTTGFGDMEWPGSAPPNRTETQLINELLIDGRLLVTGTALGTGGGGGPYLYVVPPTSFLWNGALSDDWGQDGNWTPPGIPGSGTSVTFDDTASQLTVDLNGNRTVDTVQFDAGGYTLNNDTLSLESGDMASLGTGIVTVNSNVQLLADGEWNVASGSNLVINGSLSGDFSLTKIGSGMLTLTGNNSHGGEMILQGGTVTISNDSNLGGSSAAVVLGGGTLQATSTLVTGRSFTGFGNILGRMAADANSLIHVTGGNLAVGDPASFVGFQTSGGVYIESATDSLTLHSLGFAELGGLTNINGGTINAANGMALGPGAAITGSGIVNGPMSASVGSTINATGNLTIGDAGAFDGFFSDGRLFVNDHAVTLHDANVAVLGSLTTLGDPMEGPGTLDAPNGSLLEQGKDLVGFGTISGDFINQGYVNGTGSGLEFTGDVSGIGGFDGTIILAASLSPGNSPARVTFGGDVVFGPVSQLNIEFEGTEAGQYDQISIANTVALQSELNLLPSGGYTPKLGDTFHLVDADGGRTGIFDRVSGVPIGGSSMGYAVTYDANNVDARVSLLGDTDLDDDVDTVDITMSIGNFSGVGNVGKHWALGDFDGDGDNDTVDVTTVLSKFTGADGAPVARRGPPAEQHNPDLIYEITTGEVLIDADGTTVLSFSILNDDMFTKLADFAELDASVFAGIESPLVDNTADQIGWVSAVATGGVGFDGPGLATLGAILPRNLSGADLSALLTNRIWSGPNGSGGSFDLVTVPEPSGLVLILLGVFVAVARRCRRCQFFGGL